MSKINSELFEYNLIGNGNDNGKKNIVFLNGFRMNFDSWNQVYPTFSDNHRVILFNRHGVGKSSKAKFKQTGETVVKETHTFLSALGIQPPFTFVAHSLGGVFANLYARTYPDEVSGVVFVDTPHPLEIVEQRRFKPPSFVHTTNEGIKFIEKLFDKFKYSEDECIEETISQLLNAAPFPNIPIAVVSGTKKMPFVPEKAFEIHQGYQSKMLDLSQHSTHYFCNESGHFPQVTEPEIVISAITDIVNGTQLSPTKEST